MRSALTVTALAALLFPVAAARAAPAAPPARPTLDPELTELVRDSDKGGSSHPFIWSLDFGRPLIASLSLGWLTPFTAAGQAEEFDEDWELVPATLFQLEGGAGGGKLSLGLAGALGDYGDEFRDARMAGDVKFSLLRTWWRPVGANAKRWFIGGEIDFHYLLKFGAGVFRRIGGPSGSDTWLVSATIGYGFL
jgi:hypothetical protein